MRKWKVTNCPYCRAGIAFSAGYEPKECGNCNGTGSQAIHLKSGVIALYPGGPFIGKLTQEELEEANRQEKILWEDDWWSFT